MRVIGVHIQNPKYIPRDANTKDADGQMCVHCGRPILLRYIDFKNRTLVERRLRVDCCDESEKVQSYHLHCYDIVVFGEARRQTLVKMIIFFNNSHYANA